MTYDPNQKRGGPANPGNWSKYENSDPEESFPSDVIPVSDLPDELVRPAGLSGQQLRDRPDLARTLAALDDGPKGACDLFVGSVMDGHLSRGTPGATGVNAFDSWRAEAADLGAATGDKRYLDFAAGMDRAMGTLMSEDTRILAPDDDLAEWTAAAHSRARTKRASVNNREHWMVGLQHAQSQSEWRGMMVAGAALSKTDAWWGFREDTERTILGGDLA